MVRYAIPLGVQLTWEGDGELENSGGSNPYILIVCVIRITNLCESYDLHFFRILFGKSESYNSKHMICRIRII